MRKAKDLTTLDVFTAGQVAKLLLCSPRSVAKWFDAGKLKGYRLAGTSDRRIPRVNLLEFIQANGMPFPEGISCAAPVMTPEAEDTARLVEFRDRVWQLEDVAGKLLSIVAFAIAKGLPVTQEVADARNQAVRLLPKKPVPTDYVENGVKQQFDSTNIRDTAGRNP